jgi:hypothetical protein
MKEASTLIEFANLSLLLALPLITGLIGFLSYLRGHFNNLDKVREMKERESNQNREMYIKNMVQNTIAGEINKIHEMIAELGKRIDKLFTLLKHDK